MLVGLIGIGIGLIISVAVFAVWEFIEYLFNRFSIKEYQFASGGFLTSLIIILIILIYKYML